MVRRTQFAQIYRTIFAISGWLAIFILWANNVLQRPAGTSALEAFAGTFRFFTVQTNIMVLIWYLAALLFWQKGWAKALLQPLIKGAFTLYITVTFIIFFIVLQPLSNPQGIDAFINGMVHYVTPIAFIIDWILFERKGIYQWRYALLWLIYPLAYLAFALSFGSVTGDYIYPFLNPETLGTQGLAVWIGILFTVFLLLGLLYVTANRLWRRGGETLPGESHG